MRMKEKDFNELLNWEESVSYTELFKRNPENICQDNVEERLDAFQAN